MSAAPVIEPTALAPEQSAPPSATDGSNGKPKGNHSKNGRKGGRGPGLGAALQTAVAVLADRVEGDRIATKERATENKEKDAEIEKLTKVNKQLQAALDVAKATAGDAEVKMQASHRVVVKTTIGVRRSLVFLCLVMWLPGLLVGLNLMRFMEDAGIHPIWEPIAFFFVFIFGLLYAFLNKFILIVSLAVLGSVLDVLFFLLGWSDGWAFSGFYRWEYRYLRGYEHIHPDGRPDATSVQELKHAAKYKEYLITRRLHVSNFLIRMLIGGLVRLLASKKLIRDRTVLVSSELLQQIATPKNLDPYLSSTVARSAIQRSAANNCTVSIDRAMILGGKQVHLDTVNLAYAMHLEYKQKVAKLDFLPPLPK